MKKLLFLTTILLVSNLYSQLKQSRISDYQEIALKPDKFVTIANLQGVVDVLISGSGEFTPGIVGMQLPVGSTVRTGINSYAILLFPGGHKATLAPRSTLILTEVDRTKTALELTGGKVRNFVRRLQPTEKFEIKTPIVVASVRGTDFMVSYDETGFVDVDVFKGKVSVYNISSPDDVLLVEDRMSSKILINELPKLQEFTSKPEVRAPAITKSELVSENSNDVSREQFQAKSAEELRAAEYQLGKTIIDVNGLRVRLEEYISKPQANQMKLEVFNYREKREDSFEYIWTFKDNFGSVSEVTDKIFGGYTSLTDNHPVSEIVLLKNNSGDSMKRESTGGSLKEISGKIEHSFKTNNWYVNGVDKSGLSTSDVATIYPGQLRYTVKTTYSDGTWEKWDNYVIDDQGKIISAANWTTDSRTALSTYNWQVIITATEFKDKIDLVFAPKILVDAGFFGSPKLSLPSF